ncbi:RNA-directed RNA polymerase [ssRNA phage Zoerhiza.3_5]|uniref:RNA-directed RNA polymerase n=2 Tax=Leviviricetes TaxID=2842243 RepID=A0A8S5KXU3_9VIRU|nr:RNA-directed RNA polymerase [ssRNA phage Zoerhiza.3_5]QDH88915.1 MAG: RNA-dependent RNA polymerase [Leviviridae sp.]DAD50590.1 TPA_asm: RNA-directed RNA polymerase [ssRNA phage Zoerhiza.3_5]
MKSMTDLWRELANELAGWCHTSTTQDYKKLLSRVENEGLSFLTISLPSFGKDFESCLDNGRVDDCSFSGFRRSCGLPLFLGGFLRQIFDTSSGVLLAEPSIDSIFAVRQLTTAFAKILLPCSEDRVTDAFESYVRCEQDLSSWESHGTFDASAFKRVSQLLFSDVFTEMDRLCHYGELVPRHGPGQTADRVRGNHKFDLKLWSERMESIFPFGEYAIPSWRYYNRYDDVQILEPGDEHPVRVVHVPKTLRTPRIIAMEPAYVQYMQQAILQPLVQALESEVVEGNTRHNLGSDFVGFTDQHPNRVMACRGSQGESLATLDLSEASDRVHTLHVEAMLQGFPSFREAVFATRSTKAEIPMLGIQLTPLHKFASMGSALCFPIEGMVFTTAVFLGIEEKLGRPLDRKTVMSYVGKVRVYGDDIIIPVDCVPHVTSVLARLGFKINASKSFWTGKFRESCGGDYYDGVDVTPVRVRRVFPSSRDDAEEVQSLVALRNLLYERGLWKTTRWIDEQLVGKLLPHFPIVEPTAPCLGRRSFLPYQVERWDDDTHAPRVRAYVAKSKIPASEASGIGSLLKCLLPNRGPEMSPFEDSLHLQRQAGLQLSTSN